MLSLSQRSGVGRLIFSPVGRVHLFFCVSRAWKKKVKILCVRNLREKIKYTTYAFLLCNLHEKSSAHHLQPKKHACNLHLFFATYIQ